MSVPECKLALTPEVVERRRAAMEAAHERGVKLDGYAAKVSGLRLPFAKVRSGHGEAEFAWEVVYRVLARKGVAEFWS